MDWILQQIASLLRDYSRVVDLAIQNDNFIDKVELIAIPFFVVGLIISGIRFLWKRLSRHDEKLDEQRRLAEERFKKEQEKNVEIRKRNDQLLKYDPDLFLQEMDRIERDKAIVARATYPLEWLQPIRPALARAYAVAAREKMLEQQNEQSLDDALHFARGAIAAEPGDRQNLQLLDEAKELQHLLRLEGKSESEIAALQLPTVPNDPVALTKAAESMIDKGKYKIGRLFAGRAVELATIQNGPDSVSDLNARSAYARSLGQLGQYTEAESEHRAVWEIRKKPDVLGADHPNTLNSRHETAYMMAEQGRYAEAEKELRAVWEVQKRSDVLGKDHPKTLTTRYNLAYILGEQGRYAEAERELRSILETQEKPEVLGEDHPKTLTTRHKLAHILGEQGRYVEAEGGFRDALEVSKKHSVLTRDHPYSLRAQFYLARVLDALERRNEASAHLDGLREGFLAQLFPEHRWVKELDEYLEQRN
ncbi:MAG: tetratricopeptide repeat protein [Pseudomonadota bacterium]